MKALLVTITTLVIFGGVFAPQASARDRNRHHRHHHHYDRREAVVYHDRYYDDGYYAPRYAYYDSPVYYRSYDRPYYRHYSHRPRVSFLFGF